MIVFSFFIYREYISWMCKCEFIAIHSLLPIVKRLWSVAAAIFSFISVLQMDNRLYLSDYKKPEVLANDSKVTRHLLYC